MFQSVVSKMAFAAQSERNTKITENFGLRVLPVSVWVLSRYSAGFPQSGDVHIKLVGNFKSSISENVSVDG